MPLYEFSCLACERKIDKYVALNTRSIKCQCGGKAIKLISLPGAIICDGNFSLTGKVDKRLGDTPITGRKDYNKRVKKKGFRELSTSEMKDLVDDDSKRKVPTIDL